MSKSYIGITGFNDVSQVGRVAHHIKSFPVGYVMFGFTSSNKRLLDPTSSGKTSPSLDSLQGLVRSVPKYHLPMIHYFTTNREKVAEEVIALFEYCKLDSSHCGLQLNLAWPVPSQLDAMRDVLGKDFKITMQLPKTALELSDYEIVNSLEIYEGLVSYVLIDPSGGLGLDFDIQKSVDLMIQIQEGTGITPGVAGGFSAENVEERIKQISLASGCESCHKPRLSDYCIDAQGKLRKARTTQPVYPKNAPAITSSQLSTDLVNSYIENSLKAFFEA